MKLRQLELGFMKEVREEERKDEERRLNREIRNLKIGIGIGYVAYVAGLAACFYRDRQENFDILNKILGN